ncbi:MAG: methyltransferase domain-containing protein [Minisyncoccales bacterium]
MSALVFQTKKSVGIDILEELVKTAKEIGQKLKEMMPDNHTFLEFKKGDIFNENFQEADFIFSHSTCFTKEQMEILEKKFLKLKKGTTIILATKQLTKEDFRLLDKENYRVSWGNATFYTYKKIF